MIPQVRLHTSQLKSYKSFKFTELDINASQACVFTFSDNIALLQLQMYSVLLRISENVILSCR